MRPLRERLRHVCIAVIGLVKACAARECEIQLLRIDCPHTPCLLDGIVARARAREREILERHFLILACVLVRILARDATRQFDIIFVLAADKARETIVPPLREPLRDGIAPVVGLVKARAALKVERQLLRLDRVCAADDVILLAVGMICADVFLCIEGNMVAARNRRSRAVVDLLAVCKMLRPEECREERHGLAVVDAPRRALAALGGNESLAAPVLPVLIRLCQLHLRLAALLNIGRCTISLHIADALPDQSAAPILYTALLPYGMGDRAAIVQRSHNAADVWIRLSRSLLHGSRLQGVPNVVVIRCRSRNAAEVLISYDLARIPDVLNGVLLIRKAHNAADIRVPFDRALVVGVLKGTLL